MEQNVWDRFEGAIMGHQGLLKAKQESNAVLPKVKLTTDWRKVLDKEADVAIVTGDCLELMNAMPEGSVDYIFTDPPYDPPPSALTGMPIVPLLDVNSCDGLPQIPFIV
jgi:hypothetical protein